MTSKEFLFIEEIVESKNWDLPKSIVLSPKDLSPKTDGVINKRIFNQNIESYLILKTKKPTRSFSKVFVILDCSCDIPGEKIEISIFYGDGLAYKNIITVDSLVTKRYKCDFKMFLPYNMMEHFYIKLKVLPSTRKNLDFDKIFYFYSLYLKLQI